MTFIDDGSEKSKKRIDIAKEIRKIENELTQLEIERLEKRISIMKLRVKFESINSKA